VVKYLVEEENVELNNKDLEIIKLIDKLPDEKLLMLSNYYKQENELKKQEPKPKVKKVPFNERSFPDASKLFGDLQHANNNQDKIRYLLNNASESEIDYLKFETARRNFPNLHNIRTFSIINSFIPNFIKDVKKYEKRMHMEGKYLYKPEEEFPTGKGIKFLPSNYKELKNKSLLAFGSYKAGNKNTFNEISAVMDELRRQGKISIKDIKGIFELMKIK
jgi:hypothetical protein